MDEVPNYEISDEKIIGKTNVVSVFAETNANSDKRLVLLNDVLTSLYSTTGDFIIYYFNDKGRSSRYLKDSSNEDLLSAKNPQGGFIAAMKYSGSDEKALLKNENGAIKVLQTFK